MSSTDAAPVNAVYATISAQPRVLQGSPFFRAFVCSFLNNVRSARLILFTHPPETTALLSYYFHHPRITVLPLKVEASSLQHSRYSSYLNHLRSLGCCQSSSATPSAGAAFPARIAMVDATDVVFQTDPFDHFQATESRGSRERLFVTEESRDYSLAQQASNALWVRELYGEAMLARLHSRPVLCSGFTMGHARAVVRYLRGMRAQVEELARNGQIARLRSRFGHDQSRGFDQGIHNVLVRMAWLPGGGASGGGASGGGRGNETVRALQLLDGPVLHGNGARSGRHFLFEGSTLWTPPSKEVRRRGTRGGVPFAVAHQYGKMRPKSLQARMRRELTCRGPALRTGGPPFCHEPQLCANPSWLGSGRAWNRTAP